MAYGVLQLQRRRGMRRGLPGPAQGASACPQGRWWHRAAVLSRCVAAVRRPGQAPSADPAGAGLDAGQAHGHLQLWMHGGQVTVPAAATPTDPAIKPTAIRAISAGRAATAFRRAARLGWVRVAGWCWFICFPSGAAWLVAWLLACRVAVRWSVTWPTLPVSAC